VSGFPKFPCKGIEGKARRSTRRRIWPPKLLSPPIWILKTASYLLWPRFGGHELVLHVSVVNYQEHGEYSFVELVAQFERTPQLSERLAGTWHALRSWNCHNRSVLVFVGGFQLKRPLHLHHHLFLTKIADNLNFVFIRLLLYFKYLNILLLILH
jgi:hypothetical protein